MEKKEVDVKEQINNLVNALLTFSPSRNYVIQMLRMLPEDFRIVSEAYPELFKEEKSRNLLIKVLGIRIGPKVEIGSGLGAIIKGWSDSVLSEFKKEEIRRALTDYLKEIREEVPDVSKEWLEVRLRIVMTEPTYGKDAIRVFELLVESKECSFKELCVRSRMDETVMRSILEILDKFGLIEQVKVAGEEGYRVSYWLQDYIPHLLAFLPQLRG